MAKKKTSKKQSATKSKAASISTPKPKPKPKPKKKAAKASPPETKPRAGRKPKLTLAHVTHEAVEQLGGIGTVLEGLMCSPAYKKQIARSILVGPVDTSLPIPGEARLNHTGEVLYSSVDGIDKLHLAPLLQPIEWAFNAPIVYGHRHYAPPGQQRTGDADVLLIDIRHTNPDRLNAFKSRLWFDYQIDAARHEHAWDFEEYTRLAEPAFYALNALLDRDHTCIVFAHEFMGMPTALKAKLDGGDRFRTVFHAHECSTARSIIEDHPGHDLTFYPAMRHAQQQGRCVDEVFGNLDHLSRHALVKHAFRCDAILAVGDETANELKFLSHDMAEAKVDLVYNGLPQFPTTVKQKHAARKMLADYAQTLTGQRPDLMLTHVTRPVNSKGLWRDVAVCRSLEPKLAEAGKTGVLFLLTSAGGVRSEADVLRMEEDYGWPADHREGLPDLNGPEVGIWHMIQSYNAEHPALPIVLVNQFGWSPERLGQRLPKKMDFAEFRRGTDVELGMATYEPFGISPLEPLAAGALCVISTVCGCAGFVHHSTRKRGSKNVLVADYLAPADDLPIDAALGLSIDSRSALEQPVSYTLAEDIWKLVPKTDSQRDKALERGQALVAKMGWDQVFEDQLHPVLQRIV